MPPPASDPRRPRRFGGRHDNVGFRRGGQARGGLPARKPPRGATEPAHRKRAEATSRIDVGALNAERQADQPVQNQEQRPGDEQHGGVRQHQ